MCTSLFSRRNFNTPLGHIAAVIFAIVLVTVPNISLADCQAGIKGSSSLACETSEDGDDSFVLVLKDGTTKRVSLKNAKKLTRQDSKTLKQTRREVKKLSNDLNEPVNSASVNDTLHNAEQTLDVFANPTNALESFEIETASKDQLKQVADQIERELDRTARDNKKLKKDFKKNRFRKIESICKRKKKLQPQVCSSEVSCNDGLDEDQDGLTDCEDPDCEGSDACPCQPGEHAANFAFRMGDSGNCTCYSIAFVQWDKTLSVGATSVTAFFMNSGGEQSSSDSEPYDNEYSLGSPSIALTAPLGSNWIFATGQYGADANFERCSPSCNPISGLVRNPRVEITCP